MLQRIFVADGRAARPSGAGGGTRASRCRTGPPGRRSPTSTARDWHDLAGRAARPPRGPARRRPTSEQHGAVSPSTPGCSGLLDAAAHRRHRRPDGHPGPADRRLRRRRGRLGLAGRAGRGRQRRCSAGRVQQPRARTGAPRRWCPWRLRDADYEPFIQSIRATMAGAGGLRIDHVMGLFRLWWVPADGDGRRRRLRALPGRGPAGHRGAGELPGAGARRRRGPRHRRGRRPGGHGRARRAVLPAALVRGRRARRRGRPRPWPRSPPTTCPPSPDCGPVPTSPSSRSRAPATEEELERGPDARCSSTCRASDRRRAGRAGRSSAAHRLLATAPRHAAVGHPRRRGGRAAPAEHARVRCDRPNWSPAAAGARGGPGRAPRRPHGRPGARRGDDSAVVRTPVRARAMLTRMAGGMHRGRHGPSLADRAAARVPPRRGPPGAPRARQRSRPDDGWGTAGTAGSATRPTHRAPGRAAEWRQRERLARPGRHTVAVAGPA